MNDNEDTPDFLAAEKESGFAMTHRERHIALTFWNAEKIRCENDSERQLKQWNKKLIMALKEAEAGLEIAISKLETELGDAWERSSPRLALDAVRKALGDSLDRETR
jgi:hypothetical protein